MIDASIGTYIVSNPNICNGKLTFAGTRVMVWQVLDALAQGENYEAVLEAWPSITRAHIQAALKLSASRAEGERVISIAAPEREVPSR